MSAPFTFAWHLAHRLIPGGASRAERLGRAAQEELTRMRFGSVQPGRGALPVE